MTDYEFEAWGERLWRSNDGTILKWKEMSYIHLVRAANALERSMCPADDRRVAKQMRAYAENRENYDTNNSYWTDVEELDFDD